ncbi:chitinase 10-like 4 [Homarus americanus]|uniref:chitinase n=1 Tax=Homarus americanus TaxID=6706 RepID=A0A8J5JYK0_HOMAM|nr:chitinase 10-like 4 [Homarus americanus]
MIAIRPAEVISPSVSQSASPVDVDISCTMSQGLMPDPYDCSRYRICGVDNKWISQACAPGLKFNPVKKNCDWPRNVKCATPPQADAGVQPPGPPPIPAPGSVVSTTTTTVTSSTMAPVHMYSTGDYKVVCYFTNWAWYRPNIGKYTPDNIDPTLCTHIVYGFAVLDYSNLIMKPHDSWADIDNSGWNDSAGDKYSRLVNNPAARAKFIEHVIKFIKKHNFDGLDLDWEYPVCWQVDCSKGPPSDKQAFGMWVKELSDAFKPHGLLLSTAVSPSKKVIDAGYDVPTLNQYMDWIAVMTYDFHGHWDKKTGHVAPMYYHPEDDYDYFNMDFAIRYWLEKGATKDKLVLGMPLYGQSFSINDASNTGLNSPARSGGEAGPFTRARGFLAYYEICHFIRQGWSVVKDPSGAMGPYAYSGDEYKVVCYFTNWAWYRTGEGKYTPDDIDSSLCTHIVYGFAVLDGNNLRIKPHDTWADYDNEFYKKVVAHKANGVKVLIAIGGWNDSAGNKYSRLVNSPSARAKFNEQVVQFIQKHGFDGLDLDWEYPVCWQVNCNKGPDSDKQAFADWVKELHNRLQPLGLLLSAAVSPSNKVIDKGYDVPVLSQYLDWIAVMTYDYHGQWDKMTGHVAPMYAHSQDKNLAFNTNFTIHYWIEKGADRKKLVMGMPMYGQSFTLSMSNNNGLNQGSYGGGEAGQYTRARGFLAYYEICHNILNKGWTVVRDSEGSMGPYAYKGNQWVGFDDTGTIRYKSEYIKNMGLGGGMIWALDLDDFKNRCGCEHHPLLRTINRVLRNYPVPDPKCASFGGSVSIFKDQMTGDLPARAASPSITESTPPVWTPKPTTAATTQRTTTRASSAIAAQKADYQCLTDGNMAHPNDCRKYITCNHGEGTVHKCMGNLVWDKVVCYFTNWAWYRQGAGKYKPEDIDSTLCTHIVYGFAVLDSTGLVIKPHDSWADIDNKFYEKVTALKAKGIKVTVAIGGWNDSAGDKYSRLVNNPAARRTFNDHVIEFIKKHNFDGLDLDWEYPVCWQVNCAKGNPKDKEAFAEWVKELHFAFKPHNLLLSAAVSPSYKVIDAGYNVPILNRYFDWIAVMTYDYHGHWDKKTGHVSPMYAHPDDDEVLFNTNSTIHYWIKNGADRKKLVMGMPLYGQAFGLSWGAKDHGLNVRAGNKGQAGKYTRAAGFLAYYEICLKIKQDGYTVVHDPLGTMGPYAYKGNQWVGFDDTAMIRYKSEYIKEMGLGGGMIWALDLDDFRNTCGCEPHPLLRTINRVLRNNQGPEPIPRCDIT